MNIMKRTVAIAAVTLLVTSPIAVANETSVAPTTVGSISRSLIGPACAVVGLYLASKLLSGLIATTPQETEESPAVELAEIKHVEPSVIVDTITPEAETSTPIEIKEVEAIVKDVKTTVSMDIIAPEADTNPEIDPDNIS